MDFLRDQLKKDDFDSVMQLYSQQSWIIDREHSLVELLLSAKDSERKNLIIELLLRFNFLNTKNFARYLDLMTNYIINESGFKKDRTAIASITVLDDEADSSQKILDNLKMPIHKAGWGDVKFINKFGAIGKHFKKGKNQIVCVDEFVGSGKTILNRIKTLNENLGGDFELKFCFVAGMKHGIELIEESGYEVFCPLQMNKGITDYYVNEELEVKKSLMHELELGLKKDINGKNIKTYSFGYNEAEALYSLEGNLGNTPNSVFPIFWWPQYVDGKPRNNLLYRFEEGFS